MHELRTKTWAELQAGNIAVTHNDIPFPLCPSGQTMQRASVQVDENSFWIRRHLEQCQGQTAVLHGHTRTLLIYQAILASQRNPQDPHMIFFSPDTNVLVLVVSNYDLMLTNTSISMVSGVLRIEPIWRVIGAERAKALPAFHAWR